MTHSQRSRTTVRHHLCGGRGQYQLDDIQVQAGTYTNDFPSNVRSTIEGMGMAHVVATKDVPNGKAEFVTGGTVTLRNLEVSGVSVWQPGKNGAAVWYQGGSLTLDHVYFHNNQEGNSAQ